MRIDLIEYLTQGPIGLQPDNDRCRDVPRGSVSLGRPEPWKGQFRGQLHKRQREQMAAGKG